MEPSLQFHVSTLVPRIVERLGIRFEAPIPRTTLQSIQEIMSP
jgi:hypothetical protein